MTIAKARAQGIDAYWDGYGPTATTYLRGSELYEAFQRGWLAARDAAEKNGQAVPENRLPYR